MGKLTEAQRIEVLDRMDSGESGHRLSKEYKVYSKSIYSLYSRRKGCSISDKYPLRRKYLPKNKLLDPEYFVKYYHAKVEELDDLLMIIIE